MSNSIEDWHSKIVEEKLLVVFDVNSSVNHNRQWQNKKNIFFHNSINKILYNLSFYLLYANSKCTYNRIRSNLRKSDISHHLFITIPGSRCSLRSPHIRKKTGCSELSVREFGMIKINQKSKKTGVRNESCPEDRNEQRQLFFRDKTPEI